MASEKLRRREVHKYYHSWLNSSIGFDASSDFPRPQVEGSNGIRPSKDKALTAFAQLGCLRLDVKRCIVTLISTEQQYILAEATKTLSLVSGDGETEAQDEVWFGNASLPRGQGISGDALTPPMYTAVGRNDSTFAAPALVVSNITTHDVYQSRGYAGKGVTFYCGVPILTDSGYPIGVYTVTDDKPRDGLTPPELRFMYDMAATVMRHLDSVSNEAARFRGETMVLGLGKFISGAPLIHDTTPDSQRPPIEHLSINASDMTDDNAQVRVFKGMDITAANPLNLRKNIAKAAGSPDPFSSKGKAHEAVPIGAANAEKEVQFNILPAPADMSSKPETPATPKDQPSSKSRHRSNTNSDEALDSDHIFSRAASILQECVSADGVIFFEAVSSNFARRSNISNTNPSNEHSATNPDLHGISVSDTIDAAAATESKGNNTALYSGASEESDVGPPNDVERRSCRLLGYSLEDTSQGLPDVDVLKDIQITERSLSRLVKMYPSGKLFTFDADGGISASDGETLTEDARQPATPRSMASGKFIASDRSKRIPRAVANELERLIPHAQSVVWLPLWDFARQRWSAGLFLWSKRIDRLVAAQDDLVYLKAFGNSIMVEVARRDAALADTAKATFIANISHELRTPLHGIVGNLDILQDTQLSEFQESLVAAIEVCGRTLSDTVDHVLEYSKINQLSKHNRKKNKSGSLPWQLPLLGNNTAAHASTSMTEENFDIAAIVEEAVESAYASHVFQRTGRTRLRSSSVSEDQHSKTSPDSLKKQNVHVTIDIEHRPSWWVHSQPSAIRRVVTNLFGNALKYTDAGSVQVTLSTRRSTKSSEATSHVTLLLTVKDTGRGMSADFVRNHAFVPFSQESQFSTGTGLGLSIVQQIVKSLGGKIELQSDQGTGTEMRVLLSLPAAEKGGPSHPNMASSHRSLDVLKDAELALQILSADYGNDEKTSPGISSVVSSLASTAQSWFGFNLLRPETRNDEIPDLVLFVTPPTSEQLLKTSLPLIDPSQTRYLVLAASLIEKAELTARYSGLYASSDIQVDVLSYPIGPQKLGKAILSSFNPTRSRDMAEKVEIRKQSMRDRAVPKRKFQEMAKEGTRSSQPRRPQQQQFPSQSGSIIEDASAQYHSLQSSENETPPNGVASMSGTRRHAELSSSAESSDQQPTGTSRSLSAPSLLLSTPEVLDDEPRLRILLVDDNDINLTILKTCMKRAQIPYDTAKDGLQATITFEAAAKSKQPFSHVLMDISMPVMDGIQATREIRSFERQRNGLKKVSSRTNEAQEQEVVRIESNEESTDSGGATPRAVIIALSGVAAERTQYEMLEAGADMFMPKPVKLKELLKLFET